jgi:hypothetical protein
MCEPVSLAEKSGRPQEQGIFLEIQQKTGFPGTYDRTPAEIRLSLPSVTRHPRHFPVIPLKQAVEA